MTEARFAQASFFRAMLGKVTPELRAATLDLTEGVRVRFIYAVAIDDDIRDIVDDVESEMLGDFADDVAIQATVESIPEGPMPLSQDEIPVFHRREPSGWKPS